MPERVGHLCPRCGSVGTYWNRDTAWCRNDDCEQFQWKPNSTREQNLAETYTL